MIKKKIVPAMFLALFSTQSIAIDLSGTIFNKVAQKFKLDPVLLYSVALAESASNRGKNIISPWPWTLRSPSGSFYGKSKEEMERKFHELYAINNRALDVGIMQINVFWNGHRVEKLTDLLDPHKNIMAGAEILSEAIKSSPSDLKLGIGRYNTWSDKERARNYGARVLAIYNNLKKL